MPAAFIAADVAHCTSSSEFGEDVTYKGVTVTGIFDDEDIEVVTGEGVAQIVNQAMFTGQTADFDGIADGDAMVIRGVTYAVRNWKMDGTGQIEVILERT